MIVIDCYNGRTLLCPTIQNETPAMCGLAADNNNKLYTETMIFLWNNHYNLKRPHRLTVDVVLPEPVNEVVQVTETRRRRRGE